MSAQTKRQCIINLLVITKAFGVGVVLKYESALYAYLSLKSQLLILTDDVSHLLAHYQVIHLPITNIPVRGLYVRSVPLVQLLLLLVDGNCLALELEIAFLLDLVEYIYFCSLVAASSPYDVTYL